MQEPIAIVGMGCRFPGGSTTPAAFWRMLVAGTDCIQEVPADRFDIDELFDADPSVPGKMYTRWGGFVDNMDQFDPSFFGFSRREALRIDPQHRMLLECTWEALEDAGIPPDGLAGSQTGVFIGISTHDYPDFQAQPRNRASIDAHTNSGGAGSIAANRISYAYDFRGPSFIVDTACSSSLVAVHLACQSLRSGECMLAVAGGVQAVLAPELTIGFCKASMISADGRCRAFAAEANGYVRGEGAGVIVLKLLSQALADGDPIHALIRGSAINEDGRTNGMTVPGLPAQQAVLRDAYRRAGVSPGDVRYIEAHGPGTPVGDPIEAEALASVLACELPEGEVLRIGSVKTNIGHLEAGSGIAGLIKAALIVKHRHIPPSLHFVTPSAVIPFDRFRLRVVSEGEAWPKGTPLLTGVNSFGFGGANAHVVLEGPPSAVSSKAVADVVARAELLVVSARSQESLRGIARSYRDVALSQNAPTLRDLVASAAKHRSHHEHRVAVAGRDLESLADNLDAFLNDESRADVISGRAHHGRVPRIAFVFAGMGPQWWGMGRQLLEREPVFRSIIEQCDALIRRHAEWSLIDELMKDDTTSRVSDADFAQPVNFAFQAALLALWRSWGVKPAAVVGHSAGEIAAVYATGALSLDEAVRVAFYRGLLQHRATGKGRMLAAGKGIDALRPLLANYEGRVSVAAINSPTSVTFSGDHDAIAEINSILESEGTFSRIMSVQVPYHSHHMDPIQHDLLDKLSGLHLNAPTLPIVSEVTGEWANDECFDGAYWWRNIRQPVLFGKAIGTLVADGYDTFLEVSPHPVLGASVNECIASQEKTGVCLPSLRRNDDDRNIMLRTLGSLYTRGVNVQWTTVTGEPRERVELPLYAWNKERVWIDAARVIPENETESSGPARDTTVLGHRVRSVQPHWEADLSSPALSYIHDHRIGGAIVFPGAAYVAMALEAAVDLGGGACVALESVEFKKALFVPEGGGVRVQAVYDSAARAIRIHAENGPNGQPNGWTMHSACRLSTPPAGPGATADFDAIRARCNREMSHDEFYAEVAQRGFTFGPRFMGIEQLSQGDGEALGFIHLPDAHAVDASTGRGNAALFDAGLQVLIAAVMTKEEPREGKWPAFLPTRASRVISYKPVGGAFYSHATVEKATDQGFEGTVSLYDEQGTLLLRVDGLCAKTLEGAQSAPEINDYLYHLTWEEQPRAVAATSQVPIAVNWADPSAAAESVNAETDRLSRELGFAGYYGNVEPSLDRIALAFFGRALAELNVRAEPGISTLRFLPDGTPLTGARRRLFGAIADALNAADPARNTDDDPIALIESLRKAEPTYDSVLDVVARCGLALADILLGKRGAPEVLFSGDGLGVMSTFYRDAPSCRLFNALTAEAVAAAVVSFPAGREIRVLEVGAGTGAATRDVVRRLPLQRTKYTFTDISPLFLNLARADLGDPGFMRYAVLDVERDAEVQGFELGSYDVIVAANVVHATSDVARTLSHIRSLLAPGGVVVMNEITRRPTWLDLVFGITDGWWAFTDTTLRPAHALLSIDAWKRELAAAGFEDAAAIHEHEDDVPGQSILVARAALSTVVALPDATGDLWLVLADAGEVGDSIADELRRAGRRCVVARQGGSGLFRASTEEYELPAESPAAMCELVAATEFDHGPIAGVAHLWSLDMPRLALQSSSDDIIAAQSFGYGSMLNLLHALPAAEHKTFRRVVIVTSEAQAIDEMSVVPAVTQSPIWGVGRIILHEHPELRPLLIDLSATADPREAAAVAMEAIAETREDEIALRGDRRFVRRLARLDISEPAVVEVAKESAHGRPFSVEVGTTGSMDSLILRELPPRVLVAGEIEIDVRAASLNFRDVVFAMGMLPPEAFENSLSAGAMGVDCSGVVTAVEKGVTSVRVGDEVMALAPASLASRAYTTDLAVRKPAGLSFVEAAALPLAYVTAIYALDTVARIRRGDRVLIHAATGGVGLAAIAVAQRAGAEVFATAGTELKREYLRARGIQHVMDSRTLDFADQIMAITGGRGVDVVLNSLAGDAIAKGLSILAPRGRFLEIGKADIYKNSDLSLDVFSRNISFSAIQVDLLCDTDRPAVLDAFLNALHGIEDGSLPPLPTEVFSIMSVEDALRTLAQARHVGKLVVAMDDPTVEIEPVAAAAPMFRPDATYLITGARGGVGTALSQWAANLGARHLALVSRSASADNAAEHVTKLRAAGVEVLLLDADVSNTDDVARIIAAADRSSAPLKGIFHGAMVIDDAPLSDLNSQRFARVMAPKAAGAWNLHLATRERSLDHFVMFSSITSIFGNSRQGNYAAANAFLDGFAGYRRALGLPGTTVNWGVFSDAGYVATRKDLGEYLARQGQFGHTCEQGFTAMASVMTGGFVQATVSRTEWKAWAESNPVMGASPRFRALVEMSNATGADRGKTRAGARVLETLLAHDETQRRPEVLQHLKRRVAKILGTAPDRVDAAMPLTDMGMDSLMAVELMTMLKNDVAIDVPAVKLLQGVTIDQLTDKVVEHLRSPGGNTGAATTAPAPLAAQPTPAPVVAEAPAAPFIAAVRPAQTEAAATPAMPGVVALHSSNGNGDYRYWTPAQRAARAVVSTLVRGVADVRIDGAHNIPESGPVVIAANHISMWDAPILLQISDRRTVMFAAEELRRNPFIHLTLHKIWDAIYLKRGEGDAEALDQALRVLRGGGMLGLAPEGHRSMEMQRGLSGAAYLSRMSGAPIVPLAIYGQEHIMTGMRRFSRARVRICIGAPIAVPPDNDTPQGLQAHTDRVMIAIARMLPPQYRGVWSADVDRLEAAATPRRDIA